MMRDFHMWALTIGALAITLKEIFAPKAGVTSVSPASAGRSGMKREGAPADRGLAGN